MRLKAMRQVRPVSGLVRISTGRSTNCPLGSMNFADTVWLANVSSECSSDDMAVIPNYPG
jgi:hypothetical protein